MKEKKLYIKKAFIITPTTIKRVLMIIESIPIFSIRGEKYIDHGMATSTTKIPERLSVSIVANMRTKAMIESAP